mgnify:CR=1 FL=1|jgi:hypothetical protein
MPAKNSCHRWTYYDLNTKQKEEIYQYTVKSYEKGETGKVFDEATFWEKVKGGPWVFYGDTELKGYVSVRENCELPELIKLTGMAGDKRSLLIGCKHLLAMKRPIVGAVTPELSKLAKKFGFTVIENEILKQFIAMSPSHLWGTNGKPKIGKDGFVKFTMAELGGETFKKNLICNKAFIGWAKKLIESRG